MQMELFINSIGQNWVGHWNKNIVHPIWQDWRTTRTLKCQIAKAVRNFQELKRSRVFNTSTTGWLVTSTRQ